MNKKSKLQLAFNQIDQGRQRRRVTNDPACVRVCAGIANCMYESYVFGLYSVQTRYACAYHANVLVSVWLNLYVFVYPILYIFSVTSNTTSELAILK